jgi:Protein of unknown function (DUF2442)
LNAKVIPRGQPATKSEVPRAVRDLRDVGVDIINISLDFDAEECNPTLVPALGKFAEALLVTKELDRDTACDLCLACWDVAESGVAIVAAAGNRWGGVRDVQFTEDDLIVDLLDGRTISVPLAWYPRLLSATPEQRANWRLAGGGFGNLSTAGLLRGAPAPRG